MLNYGQAIARFVSLGGNARRYLLSAIWYLLRARLIYRRQPASALVDRLRASAAWSEQNAVPVQIDARQIDAGQIHWALESAARYLPVRSDCLIQALAADLWLGNKNVARSFHLAVSRPGEDPAATDGEGMSAHAWLEVDGNVVSGGRLAPDLVAFANDENAADAPNETSL